METMFRSPKSRSSKTSEFRRIQPDGPGCNSPVQRAKHTPFSGTSALKSYKIDRSLRTSSFPPKSHRFHTILWLFFLNNIRFHFLSFPFFQPIYPLIFFPFLFPTNIPLNFLFFPFSSQYTS